MTPCLTEKPPKGSFFALLSSHNVVILEMILINQPREKHLEMTFEIKASSRLPKGHIGNQRDKLPREKHLKIIFFRQKKSSNRSLVRHTYVQLARHLKNCSGYVGDQRLNP